MFRILFAVFVLVASVASGEGLVFDLSPVETFEPLVFVSTDYVVDNFVIDGRATPVVRRSGCPDGNCPFDAFPKQRAIIQSVPTKTRANSYYHRAADPYVLAFRGNGQERRQERRERRRDRRRDRGFFVLRARAGGC